MSKNQIFNQINRVPISMHQKFPTTNPFRAVCSLIFFIGVVAQAGAQSTQLTYRFSDSSLPQDTFLYGDAKIVGGPNGYL
ncbi:hypothetical protein N8525_05140, partial [Verrucomicrobiales bacterium]|nr:hypothetical protein [Verrucomicrobiales bacterium]